MANKSEKRSGNRLLVVLLLIFIVAIGGLVAGIVVMNGKKDVSDANEEFDGIIEEQEDNTEEINAKIAEFQAQIDNAESDEQKVELYNERIFYIIDNAAAGTYGKQVIDDTVAIDNIEKTISSAAQVYNMAAVYKNEELMQKYDKITDERSAASGININDDEEAVD